MIVEKATPVPEKSSQFSKIKSLFGSLLFGSLLFGPSPVTPKIDIDTEYAESWSRIKSLSKLDGDDDTILDKYLGSFSCSKCSVGMQTYQQSTWGAGKCKEFTLRIKQQMTIYNRYTHLIDKPLVLWSDWSESKTGETTVVQRSGNLDKRFLTSFKCIGCHTSTEWWMEKRFVDGDGAEPRPYLGIYEP